MFQLTESILQRMKEINYGWQPVFEGPNILKMSGCTGGCGGNPCSSTCKGGCKNGCTRTCRGSSR